MKLTGKEYAFIICANDGKERRICAIKDDYWSALKMYHLCQKASIETNGPEKWELWRMELNPYRLLENMQNYEPKTREEINDEEAEANGQYWDYGTKAIF